MRRLQIASVMAALAVMASAPWTLSAREGTISQEQRGQIPSLSEPGEGLTIAQTSASGRAIFAASRGQGILLPVLETDSAADRALAFVDSYGAAFGLQGRADVRLARVPRRDDLGLEQVKFQQVHQGVPVAGGEFLVHLKGARAMAANGRVLEQLPSDTSPAILPAVAQGVARQVVEKYKADLAPRAQYSEPRLEIMNRAFLAHEPGGFSRLAWFVEASGPGLRQFIWIDAKNGAVLLQFSQMHTAKNRQVYNANGGGSLPGTLARSEGQGPTGNVDVDDAYTLSGVTYDFFFNSFGRDSFNGTGGTIVSSVNFDDGVTCPNAFWNSVQMVYCAGFASADDVVGHELTHAVTEYEANLYYFVQSGALNESFSDIFGETIDLVQNVTAGDTPGVRWDMGEDLPIFGAIRNMMDPTEFGDPGRVGDLLNFKCDPQTDGGGVHSNSGVPNHAYALMVDGGSYNGYSVTGIGFTKAARIQYRALSTYLTSSSGFLDNFNALMQSCSDLIGTVGITSADCAQVQNALLAVEMNHAWACFGAQIMTPAMCPAGGTPNYLFNNDFEGGAPPWVVNSTTATQWALQTFNVDEGLQAAIGPNPGSISDHRIEMSAASAVVLPPGARAIFRHLPDLEPGYDGGVVEYTINNGASWVDAVALIDAGLLPDTTIAPGFGNPLDNRNVFSMGSLGYQTSRLNLATLAGQTVRLRFRVGSDSLIPWTGWMLDRVAIYSCTMVPGAPFITMQPIPQVAAMPGATVNFTVGASSTPVIPLRYQWLKNGVAIPGATSSTLTLTNVQWTDIGFYSVIVSNDVGTATSDGAVLFVAANQAPTFLNQPVSRTIAAGQTAQFTAEAFGLPTITYQWSVSIDGGATWNPVVNGPPYSGATTGTLTITGATVGLNNYRYRVVASNGAGNATSLAVTLNVLAANMLTNGDFSAGTGGWSYFDNPGGSGEWQLNGGVFEWNRPGGAATQSVIFQTTGAAVSGTPLQAQFDLGNSSTIRKRVSVLMIDADFSDLTVCTFWLQPAAPMRTYRMRTHTTRSWTNAAIYFYAATTGNAATTGGYLRLDNVSMTYNPAGSDLRTECEDPTSPAPPGGAPSGSLLTNGTFSAGMTGWSTFGVITSQVSNGVFEFIRQGPPPATPAGVIFQPTGAAVAANEFLTATFDLGNSSAVRKRVTALILSGDFTDLAACTFWLPPGLPLATYQMKMRATQAWAAGAGTGAAFYLYAATTGFDQWIRLDNVFLQRTPGSAIVGTECIEPVEVLRPSLVEKAAVAGGFAGGAAPQQGAQSVRSFARLDFDAVSAEWFAASDMAGTRLLRWRRPINLDGASGAGLTFLSSVEGGAGLAEVQVSQDGMNWRTLARIPPDDAWTEVEVDLSEYAGQRVYLQFAYTPLLGETAAWRVMNVKVSRK